MTREFLTTTQGCLVMNATKLRGAFGTNALATEIRYVSAWTKLWLSGSGQIP